MTTLTTTSQTGFKKVLRGLDMTLFTVCAVLVLMSVFDIWHGLRNGLANNLSFTNILPKWDAGLAFLTVNVYNFMGFELMSGAAGEMKDPGKDIPRAIVVSGLLVALAKRGQKE